ncbi:amino acid adenylation domain-containing protein [Streptomyces sp. NPDC090022]|uniref:amino acid adenylation domain-containing protein n=1 Tax=Streptomyces sp. NPDC090022 TaxID=3365920 RepID=UPI0037F14207
MTDTVLPSGTEYEHLLAALRGQRPWAFARFDSPDSGAVPAPEPPPARPTLPSDSEHWVPLHARVDRLADTDGAAVALADGQRTVSYQRLRLRTDRLAARLRGLGVRRGDLVALALGRGPAFAEAVLAVWKAGAAFLPLGAEDPVAWRAALAHRAGATACVGAGPESALPGLTHVVWPDPAEHTAEHPAEHTAEHPAEHPGGHPDPADPAHPAGLGAPEPAPEERACVIPTSGSTGEPKLVVLEHRGVANLFRLQRDGLPGLGPGSRVLQYAHPTFDGALFDLALALAHGGRLEAVEDTELAGEPLAAALRRLRVTHAVLPASALRTLGDVRLDDLEVLCSVGDVLHPDTARAWSTRTALFNGYGPTEATVCATLHRVSGRAGTWRHRVPVGRAASGVYTVVLGDDLRPVPPGVPGEICIGGAGVARGYLGQPGLTAQAFVPDPLSPVPGSRLHRTGDLGRVLPNGEVELLGRRDRQVKIRGVRVRLDEVERALAAVPGVRDAVATAVDAGQGDRNLIGYVTPLPGHPLTGAAALAALRARTPAHLVPGTVVVLDDLPLTPSGKPDRARLPEPRVSAPYRAPRTSGQRMLTSTAGAVLGLDRVGLDDTFAALGGNSLLATRFAARVAEATGHRLRITDILSGATMAELAELAELAEPAAYDGPAAGRPSGPGRSPSYAQERVWLMQRLHPDSHAYHADAAIRITGRLDLAGLRASLTDLVRRQEVLRSRFHSEDGRLRCTVVEPWEVSPAVVDLSGAAGDAEQGRLLADAVREFTGRPFDLAAEPPVRWLLVRLGTDEHVLVHSEHHLVHDGWSFNVFLHDLVEGCLDHARHGETRRSALPVRYYDQARWERQWSAGPEADRQRRFWRRQLAGAQPVLPLPRRAAADRASAGAAPRTEIEGDLARSVEELGRRHGCSLFATLLAGFFALLHRATGAQDVLVGSGLANRRWQDTERVMGMFVNTVVLRGDMTDDPSFSEFLDRVNRTTLAALEHQELPFEEVLAQADAARTPGVNPLVQAVFSFHDSLPDRFTSVPFGLDVIEGLGTGSAKFELNVIAFPRRSAGDGAVGRRAGNVLAIPASPGAPALPHPSAELDGVTLSWEYDTRALDARFVAGLIQGYPAVLRAVLDDPDLPLSRLPLPAGAGSDDLPEGAGGARGARAHLPGAPPATVPGAVPADPPAAVPAAEAAVLARILADLLDLPKVGPHEDFFALGGHSLLAMRYAARAGLELNREIDLATVLAHPTVAGLALALPRSAPDAPPRRLPRSSGGSPGRSAP